MEEQPAYPFATELLPPIPILCAQEMEIVLLQICAIVPLDGRDTIVRFQCASLSIAPIVQCALEKVVVLLPTTVHVILDITEPIARVVKSDSL